MAFDTLQALQAFGMGEQAAAARRQQEQQTRTRGALTDYLLAAGRRATPMRPGGPSNGGVISGIGNNPPELRTVGAGFSPASGGMVPRASDMPASVAPPRASIQQLAELGQAAVDPERAAYEQLAREAPEQAFDARKHILELDDKDLKLWSSVTSAGLQIMGGVRDQQTYDLAKDRARDLYQRYGLDPAAIDTLPDAYSPEAIERARMEAMESKDQLAAVRAERKLDWDIEDDEIDNERDDRNLGSQIEYREGQLANTRRGQDLGDARGRRGQDIASTDRRRGQELSDDRGRRGQDMTDARGRRGQDVRDGTARRGQDLRAQLRGRRVAGVPVSDSEPMARDAQGRPLVVRNGQWVPAQ